MACALGSTCPWTIGGEDARHDELLAAMNWLARHEHAARLMSASDLFRRLRGIAVRGSNGSARSTQADAVHGMTGLIPGQPARFAPEPVT
ncbi:hypothetical protein [Segeticoccus rhizosphaerae]|uniref:hypothetical protein n=1 Tax=Segeticoccus rhizosphaerae TaxID=1104777 RepID=UPI0012648D0C|nr:hypothetical protein [Segeticoccus rhizosphaerae]